MTTSLVPAVIDQLVGLFTAAATIGAAVPPVAVYDGPVVTAEPAPLVLWVGMDDPDSETAPTGAEVSQEWVGLGARQRDEDGTVHCVAEAWTGAGGLSTVRTAVFGVVAAVENLIRTDATLGGLLPSGWCQLAGGELRQNQTETGAVARVAFRITYRARI